LQALSLPTFEAYCGYLFSGDGMRRELPLMLDEVTTHKTDFFREPRHFELLRELVLDPGGGPYRLWSAACSTGEEVWTMAMVAAEAGVRFTVLGTDISEGVLAEARRAVYSEQRAAPIPPAMREHWLLRSRDAGRRLVRIAPHLRAQVEFRMFNLAGEGRRPEAMHAIFCRNVLIYFDVRTRARVVERLCACLAPGGYLFTGHSETLNGLDLPLLNVAATVYQRVST
jgi:chemotaxis protein methyltransferase CheR